VNQHWNAWFMHSAGPEQFCGLNPPLPTNRSSITIRGNRAHCVVSYKRHATPLEQSLHRLKAALHIPD
jgi:hypothetical protein